jgi:hypothetical protein
MLRDNPSHILRTLDQRLKHPVELTLIGKAALWLGYEAPPEDYGSTLDVDAVIPAAASAALDQDLAFWEALAQANDDLRPLNLYLTHLFEDRQIFLRAGWAGLRVRVSRPALEHISLFRPATLDLILTKMMRGADVTHMAEIQWMIHQDQITRTEMLRCLDETIIPDDSPEWPALFAEAKQAVMQMQFATDK